MNFKVQVADVHANTFSKFEKNLVRDTRDIGVWSCASNWTVPTNGAEHLKNASIDFHEDWNEFSGLDYSLSLRGKND